MEKSGNCAPHVKGEAKVTIYEIDQRIMDLVDPETGELLDLEAFESLRMEREQKIEGMALWVKELAATASAIKAEIDTLQERKRAAERKADSLKQYLSFLLGGEKFQTPRCTVSYRCSTAVQLDEQEDLVRWLECNGYDHCVSYKSPEVSKSEVGKLIKSGIPVPYASLIERKSLGVK